MFNPEVTLFCEHPSCRDQRHGKREACENGVNDCLYFVFFVCLQKMVVNRDVSVRLKSMCSGVSMSWVHFFRFAHLYLMVLWVAKMSKPHGGTGNLLLTTWGINIGESLNMFIDVREELHFRGDNLY